MADQPKTEFFSFYPGEVLTRHFAASVAQIAVTLSLAAQLQGQKIERALALEQAMGWVVDSHELVVALLKNLPEHPPTGDA